MERLVSRRNPPGRRPTRHPLDRRDPMSISHDELLKRLNVTPEDRAAIDQEKTAIGARHAAYAQTLAELRKARNLTQVTLAEAPRHHPGRGLTRRASIRPLPLYALPVRGSDGWRARAVRPVPRQRRARPDRHWRHRAGSRLAANLPATRSPRRGVGSASAPGTDRQALQRLRRPKPGAGSQAHLAQSA